MSKLFYKLVFVALAPLLLVSPAAATDLLHYDNGYAELVGRAEQIVDQKYSP